MELSGRTEVVLVKHGGGIVERALLLGGKAARARLGAAGAKRDQRGEAGKSKAGLHGLLSVPVSREPSLKSGQRKRAVRLAAHGPSNRL